VSNSDLKWPSTISTNPSVGGLSARGAFFGSGSSIGRIGFFIEGAVNGYLSVTDIFTTAAMAFALIYITPAGWNADLEPPPHRLI
jgi:hypothetical protein